MKRDMLFYHPESESYVAGSEVDADNTLINVTGDDYHVREAILQGEWVGSTPLPRDLCIKNTEHGHQTALFAWTATIARVGIEPRLWHFFAVPNGGARGNDAYSAKRTGAMMVAEGVRKGIPDTFLPVPVDALASSQANKLRHRFGDTIPIAGRYLAGLWIEMKTTGGKVSPDQMERLKGLQGQGYATAICWDWREAADTIRMYLGF